MTVKFSTLLLLGLLGCSLPESSPSASPSRPAQQTIKNWQMRAQGPDQWTLSAQSAEQRNQRWQLTGLHWKSAHSRIEVRSPLARQTLAQSFVLQPVTISSSEIQAQAPTAELNLDSRRLQGKHLQLKAKGWSLQAAEFRAPFPLKKWQLNKVHARFETGK